MYSVRYTVVMKMVGISTFLWMKNRPNTGVKFGWILKSLGLLNTNFGRSQKREDTEEYLDPYVFNIIEQYHN